jgi:hypothetical protein
VALDSGTARSTPSRGWFVTLGTVVGMVVAMGLTLFGIGSPDHALAGYDASSWLWSSRKSEMARANGVTGRVDTRLRVPGAYGHTMQVSQTDEFLILRDLNTGKVSALDLATLQVIATSPTPAGIGVSVAMHDDAAFVIDAVQGIVRQLNPRTLTPIGEPVRFPPGITGGVFDGDGRLWIAVPSEGTVVAVRPAPPPGGTAGARGDAGARVDRGSGDDRRGAGPRQIGTTPVAAPSHDLTISALDQGVAVLDRTTGTLTTLRGGRRSAVPLGLAGPGTMPARSNGGTVPVTVVEDRHVYAVGADGVRDFTVPGAGGRLDPAVAWSGRYYCADEATGSVYVFDADGRLVHTLAGNPGRLELEVRENYLFINAPASATARVVDERHAVRVVDKYANGVLGGDVPPTPPPPPPTKRVVGPPGPPRNVTASAGDASARVSWRPAAANGAPILRYVVQVAGQRHEVGADQRSLEVTGLVNGQTYRLSVHAVNAKGAGPKRRSNPVVPTAAVPDPPAKVAAEEHADGTVTVSWPAADGQGLDVVRYAVTAVSAGATTPVGEVATTKLTVPAGGLEYGTQYAFTVVAVNEKGAGSKPSPASNTVVPYTVPDRPADLRATTVPDRPGTIRVGWRAPADNGRPIDRYAVEAAGRSRDVTDAITVTLDGLGDGQNVTVKVRAVNEAGPGPDASATARTVAEPAVTVTGGSADHTSITVTFSVNDGGGDTTCALAVSGGPTQAGACSGIRVGGLQPSTAYAFTVTATNPAGAGRATGTRSTPAVWGRSVCVNNLSSSDPAQHTWCDNPINGMEVFSGPSQSTTRLGRGSNGERFQAICRTLGEEINDYVYNPGKTDYTKIWIRLHYKTKVGYMSFAWFNLEGYPVNSTGPLPDC